MADSFVVTNNQRAVRGLLRALQRPWIVALTDRGSYVTGLLRENLVCGGTVIGCEGKVKHIDFIDRPDVFILPGVVRSVVGGYVGERVFLLADIDNPFDADEIEGALAISTVACSTLVGLAVFGEGCRDVSSAVAVQHLSRQPMSIAK